MVEFKMKNKNQYKANKLRAHPFYFYKFPIYVAFLSILYWIVLCPILYSLLVQRVERLSTLSIPFFIMFLTLYLILILILLCIWRCKCQNEGNIGLGIHENMINLENSIYPTLRKKPYTDKNFISLQPLKSSNNTTGCSCQRNNCRQCSTKSEPLKLCIINENIPSMDESIVMHQTPSQDCEYFIANVSSPKMCTSEVFLYVEDNMPQPSPDKINMILHEEDEH